MILFTLHMLWSFSTSFSCNSMPCSGCSALYRVNPVIVWVSWRKQLLSSSSIERTASQFWKKKLSPNRKLDNEKLVFQSDVRIFVCENLTPNNQHLAWICRELKWASKIHSCWSTEGVVKITRTMNKHPIAITHDTDIASLYLDFAFRVVTRSGWVAFQRANKISLSWSGCCFTLHPLIIYDYKESLKYTRKKQHVTFII